MNNKFDQQEREYFIPYHYLPYFDLNATPHIGRALPWGFSYLILIQEIIRQVRGIAPKSVLDVGCGDGRLLGIIKNYVPYCAGIDLSSRALQFAKVFIPDIDLECTSVENLEVDQYDCVILMDVLEHIPNEQVNDMLSALRRILHSNGNLILSVPSDNVTCIPKHYRHYNPETLESQLSPYFKIKQWIYLGPSPKLTSLLERLLYNRYYILNYNPLLNIIWRVYKKQSRIQSFHKAQHIVVIAQ